jgi:hypothetical protein
MYERDIQYAPTYSSMNDRICLIFMYIFVCQIIGVARIVPNAAIR